MDSVASCREKLAHFRLKDLKDVLTQLSVSKQGKKQDLINRIMSLLSDDQASRFLTGGKRSTIGREGIAKIIEDTYRKIRFSGANDLALDNHNLETIPVNHKMELIDAIKVDMKVLCPCGHSVMTESMVKCEDSTCQVWQHVSCVVVPEKPMECVQPGIPEHFFCEICRIKRADPYWVTLSHPLLPSKLSYLSTPQDGMGNMQITEKTFQLSKADKDLLQKSQCELQVWCILLNDKVPFRMHWPQCTELRVNGVSVRTTNRPGSQMLGANGRDDGPIVTRCRQEGINKISISKSDPRVFCFGIRIARRRTFEEVMSLIPKESEGEYFEDALARVCRCVGGGTAENADSDSDIEVVADSVAFNLRCPMSGARIKTAGRFKPCVHMGCFDLAAFVELNQRSRKWQCPICLKNYSLEDVIIDPYFNRITTMLRDCEEDVDEIEIKPDGSWRVKSIEYKGLRQWNLPDGSCLISNPNMKSEPEIVKMFDQNAFFEQRKDINGLSGNDIQELGKLPVLDSCAVVQFQNHYQQIDFVTSTATESYRDEEDSGVNLNGRGHFDFSTPNAYDFGPRLDFVIGHSSNDTVVPGPVDNDVILLSDSEEYNAPLGPTGPAYDEQLVGAPLFPYDSADHGIPGDVSAVGTGSTPCMETFGYGDDFGAPHWPLSTCNQVDLSSTPTGPFEFLNIDANAETENALDEADRTILSWPFMNSSMIGMDEVRRNASQMGEYLCGHPNMQDNIDLLPNPLSLDNADPSFQIFLPTEPSAEPVRRNLNTQEGIPDSFEAGDWISLRLGDTDLCDTAPSQHIGNSGRSSPSRLGGIDYLADPGSLHLSMNVERSNKASGNFQKSDHPSRSVKPRLSLSIDMNFD